MLVKQKALVHFEIQIEDARGHVKHAVISFQRLKRFLRLQICPAHYPNQEY